MNKHHQTTTIVIPDESAYSGRDPVSSKVLFFVDSPPQADQRRIPE
jgi:hypothetical protein